MKTINMNKKNLNYILIGMIIFLIAILNIFNAYNFLSNCSGKNISLQDIIIYIIYGFGENSKTTFIDILRFAIPYLLTIFLCGIYIENMLETGRKYIQIIRYKGYKYWLRSNIKILFLYIIFIFIIYYFLLVIISLLFVNNTTGITDFFYKINLYTNFNISFYKIVIYQYFINVFLTLNIILIEIFLSLLLKDTIKSYIFVNLLIFLFSTLGTYRIYNPFMISRHKFICHIYKISPVTTIFFSFITCILLYVSIIKLIKSIIRRDEI
ncbi:membrane-spanning permease [Clostridium tetani]|nr:membrane-spanning permease [Clostridium tetani]